MNDTIFLFFYNLSHKSIFFDNLVIFFAYYFPYIVAITAGIFILMYYEVFQSKNSYQVFLQKKIEILKPFFIGASAWIFTQILKSLFSIGRPIETLVGINPLLVKDDYSFPSGHATFFMALAVSIFLFNKKAGYVFIVFALLIGVARIITGVHFPVDILVGFILGTIVALLFKKYS